MALSLLILCLGDVALAARHSLAKTGEVHESPSVSLLEAKSDAFLHGRQVLKKIQAEAESSRGDEFISYLAKATLEKCEDLRVTNSARNVNGTEQLKRTLKDLCQQTDSANVVSQMLSLMDNDLVAKWFCRGLESAMSQDEIAHCKDAGKLVLGGLTNMAEVKNLGSKLAMMHLYALKIATIFIPLPPPLGIIIEKGTNMALSRLATEAETQLENLETKMTAMMRKTLSQELLRLGTAQARAADTQIQEMLTLDTLLNDMVSKSGKGANGDFATAMAQVTSFNRWAIIEHDLSTSTELLRPPDHLEDVEERAHFASLMATHLEMYILVLSQMHRVTSGGSSESEFEEALKTKARRMGRMLLPDLVLLYGGASEQFAADRGLKGLSQSLRTLASPLLSDFGPSSCSSTTSTPSPRSDLCCRLYREKWHWEFLVTCLWLPLLDDGGDFAKPLQPRASSSEASCLFLPDRQMKQPDEDQPHLKLSDQTSRVASCGADQVLRAMLQQWTPRAFFSDREDIEFLCGDASSAVMLPWSFSTQGLCLERVRLLQNQVVAVVTSAQFAQPATEQHFSQIDRSTCRLAYRLVGRPYDGPRDWKLAEASRSRRPNGTVCEHCHWADPESCKYKQKKTYLLIPKQKAPQKPMGYAPGFG